MNTLLRVQEVFRDVFDDDSLVLTEHMSAVDIEDWDSFMQIRLIVALEKKFAVHFHPKDLDKLTNIGDMICLLNSKLES